MNWAGIGCQGLETGWKICLLIPDPRFPALGPKMVQRARIFLPGGVAAVLEASRMDLYDQLLRALRPRQVQKYAHAELFLFGSLLANERFF